MIIGNSICANKPFRKRFQKIRVSNSMIFYREMKEKETKILLKKTKIVLT